MLAVLMLMLAQVSAQVPCEPGETTLVCHCKAGQASACTMLKELEPKAFAKLRDALSVVQAAKNLEASQGSSAETQDQADSTSYEATDCKGQQHHVISRPIADELDNHDTLRGLYKPRDSRFVTRAVDEKAHCGYQHWHRDLDKEIIDWLRENPKATPKQFEAELRKLYSRPELRARFPNEF